MFAARAEECPFVLQSSQPFKPSTPSETSDFFCVFMLSRVLTIVNMEQLYNSPFSQKLRSSVAKLWSSKSLFGTPEVNVVTNNVEFPESQKKKTIPPSPSVEAEDGLYSKEAVRKVAKAAYEAGVLSRKASLTAGTLDRTRRSVVVHSSLFEHTIADAMPTRTSTDDARVPPSEPTSQSTPLGPLATRRNCHQFRDAKDNAAAAVTLQDTAAVAELSMGNELGQQEQQGSTPPGQSQQPPADLSPREDVEILPTRRLDLDKVDFKTFVHENTSLSRALTIVASQEASASASFPSPSSSSSHEHEYTANEASATAVPITSAPSTRPLQDYETFGWTRAPHAGQQRDLTRSQHGENGDFSDVKSQRGEASSSSADTSSTKNSATSCCVTTPIERAFPHAELGTPGVFSCDPLPEEVNVCAHSELSTLSTYDNPTPATFTTFDFAEQRNDLLRNDWEQEFHPWRWKHCEIDLRQLSHPRTTENWSISARRSFLLEADLPTGTLFICCQ